MKILHIQHLLIIITICLQQYNASCLETHDHTETGKKIDSKLENNNSIEMNNRTSKNLTSVNNKVKTNERMQNVLEKGIGNGDYATFTDDDEMQIENSNDNVEGEQKNDESKSNLLNGNQRQDNSNSTLCVDEAPCSSEDNKMNMTPFFNANENEEEECVNNNFESSKLDYRNNTDVSANNHGVRKMNTFSNSDECDQIENEIDSKPIMTRNSYANGSTTKREKKSKERLHPAECQNPIEINPFTYKNQEKKANKRSKNTTRICKDLEPMQEPELEIKPKKSQFTQIPEIKYDNTNLEIICIEDKPVPKKSKPIMDSYMGDEEPLKNTNCAQTKNKSSIKQRKNNNLSKKGKNKDYDWSPKMRKVIVAGKPRKICIVKVIPVPVDKNGRPWKKKKKCNTKIKRSKRNNIKIEDIDDDKILKDFDEYESENEDETVEDGKEDGIMDNVHEILKSPKTSRKKYNSSLKDFY